MASDITNNTSAGAGAGAVAGAGAGSQYGGWGALIGAVAGAGVGTAAGQHYGRGMKKRKNAMDDAMRLYMERLDEERAKFGDLNADSRAGAEQNIQAWRDALDQHITSGPDLAAVSAQRQLEAQGRAADLRGQAFAGQPAGDAMERREFAEALGRAQAVSDPLAVQRGVEQAQLQEREHRQTLELGQAVSGREVQDLQSMAQVRHADNSAALAKLVNEFPTLWEEASRAGDRQLMLAATAHAVGNAMAGGGGGGGGMGGGGGNMGSMGQWNTGGAGQQPSDSHHQSTSSL